jgi:hypothetical protein
MMTSSLTELPAIPHPDGIVIHVRLTPKSSSAHVAGAELHGGKRVLKAYVTSPPEDGKANAALVAVIAAWMSVPKSTVAIASGEKSRLKSITVSGNSDELLKKLGILLAHREASGFKLKKKR